MEARGASEGERKTVTHVFADLKGSTALIEGLDPEEARAIIDPALQIMMDAVHRYEGFVAQALGDGIFALFGAPIAHEDHPQRALYAALRMQEEMRRYSDTLRAQGRAPLLMRVGVNTGEVVVEDLHWIDSETQAFLDLLAESVASARIVVLVNYRPEYRHEWGTKTYYSQLRLAPLGKEEAEELLTFLLGTDSGLTGLKRLILAKTEGTPFFMEEVVQTLVEEQVLRGERGNYRLEKAPSELHLSPTVQGVLAARIDRLGAEEKELLQQLAVIGREFPLSLVHQVVPQPEAELYGVLA
jgi:hypothetical protein